MEKKRIYLSSPTMHGKEQEFVKEAFDTNWVAPLGPNVDALEKAIRKVCTQHPFDAGHCVNRARQFDLKTAYDPYLTLYRQKAGESA